MHKTVKNLENINNEIRLKVKENIFPTIIAVTKTFKIEDIIPLIKHGHLHLEKTKFKRLKNGAIWKLNILTLNHLIGGLQTNKVKLAVKIFDYIHSVDNEKLAKKFLKNKKQSKELKFLFK